ncbi:BrnT family toxin [Marivita sp. S6314]|uniref:BrnT family toxin n=1 Tax=Marivita sp. S6314 TaxID=2926406 RepID=UPI001FF46B16|nr:BrnT family toxin [Marivita sp. S6314]MCK0151223.1 BrnT family toxin [Marivita sp. S6314]
MTDGMEFEWDETKRQLVLAKHGFDFLDLVKLFDDRMVILSSPREEPRWVGICMVDRREVAVIFTRRAERIRLITARRARRNERKQYHAHNS